jgi:formyltetrahydrofolate synthetase
MSSDIEIARQTPLKDIKEIAENIGIKEDELELYGRYKAKVKLSLLERLKSNRQGKYIDVTAITPTPLGEGKTLTTIGLGLGLNKLGRKAISCIREPSLGLVFGIKGGATGGGRCQVLPMEEINLHLTGDHHAVSIAHNLLVAFLDNSILKDNPLNIDPLTVNLRRVIDVNDRSLRNIVTGLGSKMDGISRESGFDTTACSEVMAILALSSDLKDMRKRLSKIVAAFTKEKRPVTAEDLKVAGAMAVILKKAIEPNLLQTTENTPCFIHTGPFANIAHGNSSIIADKIALRLADYCITESGFGADCGAEKFFDIKCYYSGLKPDCAVLVASVRALKMHSGKFEVIAGKPLDKELIRSNPEAVKEGCSNLKKQIENVKIFGVPAVVAINRFETDTDEEIEVIKRCALESGADDVAESNVYRAGSAGAVELAEAVEKVSSKPSNFKFLYKEHDSIKEKIETIAKKIYGAGDVKYSKKALKKIKLYTELGYNDLPICIAKTHLSLSHIPSLKGRPRGFTLPVKDIRISGGAGFVYILCGKINTMPGLPSRPAGQNMDLDKNGNIKGLF